MKGTVIRNLKLIKVIDGDTIKVLLENEQESIRFACLDTEESQHGSDKPVTQAGLLASKWAKQYFGANDQGVPTGDKRVDLEFDTNDPVPACLNKHRDNYGRLLCYIYQTGKSENANVRLVQEGWSPYFVKYGRSRLYHRLFMMAEAEAQAKISGSGIRPPMGAARVVTTPISFPGGTCAIAWCRTTAPWGYSPGLYRCALTMQICWRLPIRVAMSPYFATYNRGLINGRGTGL